MLELFLFQEHIFSETHLIKEIRISIALQTGHFQKVFDYIWTRSDWDDYHLLFCVHL